MKYGTFDIQGAILGLTGPTFNGVPVNGSLSLGEGQGSAIARMGSSRGSTSIFGPSAFTSGHSIFGSTYGTTNRWEVFPQLRTIYAQFDGSTFGTDEFGDEYIIRLPNVSSSEGGFSELISADIQLIHGGEVPSTGSIHNYPILTIGASSNVIAHAIDFIDYSEVHQSTEEGASTDPSSPFFWSVPFSSNGTYMWPFTIGTFSTDPRVSTTLSNSSGGLYLRVNGQGALPGFNGSTWILRLLVRDVPSEYVIITT